jgi:hypothetical protein
MSVGNSRIGVEVTEIKCRGSVSIPGWYASAHVVATGVDGRRSQGWVHLATNGKSITIEGYDEHDDVDPGLLAFVVATESQAIITAVQARVAQARMAA